VTRVRIQPLHTELGKAIPYPARMSSGAAGFDLAAAIDSTQVLKPGERLLVPCGFSMTMPEGLEAQLRPRSGLALRHGVTLLNAPATIDADYRGQVQVLLINLGSEPFVIERGSRIAQMVFASTTVPALDVVASLDDTGRGHGGFGSTG